MLLENEHREISVVSDHMLRDKNTSLYMPVTKKVLLFSDSKLQDIIEKREVDAFNNK